MNLREKQIRPGDRRHEIISDRSESKQFSIREIALGVWEIQREREEMNRTLQVEPGTSRRNVYLLASALVMGAPESWARSLIAPTPL